MNARSLAARALVALTALAAVAPGQNPVVVKTNLIPACSDSVVACDDFDGSGLPDLVQAASAGLPVPVLRTIHDPGVAGSGACQTTPITVLTNLVPVVQVFPANLNGDAYRDAILGGGQQWIGEAWGDGAGGFTFPGTGPYVLPITFTAAPVVVRDLDANGRDDVVVSRGFPFVVEVFLNLPSGWTLAFSHVLAVQAQSFGSGDFDGDGLLDLMWVESPSPFPPTTLPSALRIARGVGNGTFNVSASTIPIGAAGAWLADVADLDLDGFADVLVSPSAFPLGQPVAVIFGAPGPGLPPVTPVASRLDAFTFGKIVDFDRDGIRDIVQEAYPGLLTTSSRTIMFFRGLGARQFTAPFVVATNTFTVPFTFSRMFAADADGDQDVDLFRVEIGLGNPLLSLELYRNQTVFSPGCGGSSGMVPAISVGTAHPGNAAFAIGLGSALPNVPAVLGLSLARTAITGCGIALNLGLAHMILPTPALGLTATDASGSALLTLPLPASVVSGLVVYAQWGVLDPNGALPFSGQSYAATPGRTILVW